MHYKVSHYDPNYRKFPNLTVVAASSPTDFPIPLAQFLLNMVWNVFAILQLHIYNIVVKHHKTPTAIYSLFTFVKEDSEVASLRLVGK